MNRRNEPTYFLEDRINNAEKSLTNICKEFIGYTRRTAKKRNNGDEISLLLKAYIEKQHYKNCNFDMFSQFCDTLTKIQDYRNFEVEKIKDHVIEPLINFTHSIKDVKVDIKKYGTAHKKEQQAIKNLERMRGRDSGTPKEAKLKNDNYLAQTQARQEFESVESEMKKFEARKLETVLHSLKSFVQIEMLWHMRALEHYTNAYKSLNQVDCEQDLKEFQNLLYKNTNGTLVRATSSPSLFNNTGPPMNLNRATSASHGNIAHNTTNDVHFSSRANSFNVEPTPKERLHISESKESRTHASFSSPMHEAINKPQPKSRNTIVNKSRESDFYSDDDLEDEDDEDDEDNSDLRNPSTTEGTTSVGNTSRR